MLSPEGEPRISLTCSAVFVFGVLMLSFWGLFPVSWIIPFYATFQNDCGGTWTGNCSQGLLLNDLKKTLENRCGQHCCLQQVGSIEITDMTFLRLKGNLLSWLLTCTCPRTHTELHSCRWEQTISIARTSEETLAENVADPSWRSGKSDKGVNSFEYPAGLSRDFVLGFGISLTKQGTWRLIARDNSFVYIA